MSVEQLIQSVKYQIELNAGQTQLLELLPKSNDVNEAVAFNNEIKEQLEMLLKKYNTFIL